MRAGTEAVRAGLPLSARISHNAAMNTQLVKPQPVQRRLMKRISDRLCANTRSVQQADLKQLAGGDLLAVLQDLGNELRRELHQRRASRAALVEHSATA